jgi:SpoVK/Ycf46/Vps4 family AAA+-type ATPase
MDAEVLEHRDVTENDVIRLADRMTLDDKIVSLEQRFRNKLEMFVHDDRACKAIIKKFIQAKKLRRKVEKALGERFLPNFSGAYGRLDETFEDNLLTQAW